MSFWKKSNWRLWENAWEILRWKLIGDIHQQWTATDHICELLPLEMYCEDTWYMLIGFPAIINHFLESRQRMFLVISTFHHKGYSPISTLHYSIFLVFSPSVSFIDISHNWLTWLSESNPSCRVCRRGIGPPDASEAVQQTSYCLPIDTFPVGDSDSIISPIFSYIKNNNIRFLVKGIIYFHCSATGIFVSPLSVESYIDNTYNCSSATHKPNFRLLTHDLRYNSCLDILGGSTSILSAYWLVFV